MIVFKVNLFLNYVVEDQRQSTALVQGFLNEEQVLLCHLVSAVAGVRLARVDDF